MDIVSAKWVNDERTDVRIAGTKGPPWFVAHPSAHFLSTALTDSGVSISDPDPGPTALNRKQKLEAWLKTDEPAAIVFRAELDRRMKGNSGKSQDQVLDDIVTEAGEPSV